MAGAQQERADAQYGKYLQGAYGTGLNGQVLPGSTIIADDNGNKTVVGSTNAGHATKAQSNAAQFNDVHGALDTVENAAKTLVSKGGKLNSPGVAAAMAQPSGTLGQWLQGEGVKANLSPEGALTFRLSLRRTRTFRRLESRRAALLPIQQFRSWTRSSPALQLQTWNNS